jgi:hypothetical protein
MINGNSDSRYILKQVIEFILLLRIRRRNIGLAVVWPGRDIGIVSIYLLLVYLIMNNLMKSSLSDEVFNLMDALRSPVLTHSTSWADCIPERLMKIVPEDRLKCLYKQEELASDAECVAFITTAALCFPLDGDWVDIFTHLSCKIAQIYWQEDHWDQIMAPKVLSTYLINEELKRLKTHIYEKRRKILKERMKESIPRKVESFEMIYPEKPQLIQLQLNLF